jgi:hypothetical protein
VTEMEYRLANRIIYMRKSRIVLCLSTSYGQLGSILNQAVIGLSELKPWIQQSEVC